MVYFKFYYVLLDLKKVVISVCFNVTIYIMFELIESLVHYIFLIMFFLLFFFKLTYLLLVYNKKLSFSFFFQLDSLSSICTTWAQSNNTNIAKGNYNLQNPIFCPRVSHYNHIYFFFFFLKLYKCFVLLMSVIMTIKLIKKIGVSYLKTDDYDHKKNLMKKMTQERMWIKMSVIIKGGKTCSWSRPSERAFLGLTTWANQSFIVVGEWMRNSQFCSLGNNCPFPRYWRCRRAPVTTMCTFARLQAVFRLFSANPAWFQKVVYTSILVLPVGMVWVSEFFFFNFFFFFFFFFFYIFFNNNKFK